MPVQLSPRKLYDAKLRDKIESNWHTLCNHQAEKLVRGDFVSCLLAASVLHSTHFYGTGIALKFPGPTSVPC